MNLQDKICNVLTLAGLLCVIGFGGASLLPEREVVPASVEPEPEPQAEAAPADTLEEVPMIETRIEPLPADTDSVAVVPDSLYLDDEALPDSAVARPHSSHEAEAGNVPPSAKHPADSLKGKSARPQRAAHTESPAH